jgi:hypothetical protein
MDATVSDKLDIKAQAWRVSFSKSPPKDQTVFMTVREPEIAVATARPIEVAEALRCHESSTSYMARWHRSGAVAERLRRKNRCW